MLVHGHVQWSRRINDSKRHKLFRSLMVNSNAISLQSRRTTHQSKSAPNKMNRAFPQHPIKREPSPSTRSDMRRHAMTNVQDSLSPKHLSGISEQTTKFSTCRKAHSTPERGDNSNTTCNFGSVTSRKQHCMKGRVFIPKGPLAPNVTSQPLTSHTSQRLIRTITCQLDLE